MSAIPKDQAADLRLLMATRGSSHCASQSVRASLRRRTARVVAVASGKGGVGKTSIAVNLALRLSQSGHRVVLVDADLGTANADLLLNVHARSNLAALVSGRASIDEVLTPINARMNLVAGASGLAAVADLSSHDRRALVDDLSSLEARTDIILIDCGAGISQNVLAFAHAADDLLVVTTPEPTAITDAYALVKVLSRAAELPAVHVVMNQALSDEEGRTSAARLTSVASRFLGVEVSLIGQIARDEHVGRAVRLRAPFVQRFPRCLASSGISALANRVALPVASTSDDSGFFQRVLRFFH
ncbi:MAG: MinD/ParA family protein [Phycisphaerae bacterium]|nr:MinD/ParA family protein [Phycisphaerae bacterium]